MTASGIEWYHKSKRLRTRKKSGFRFQNKTKGNLIPGSFYLFWLLELVRKNTNKLPLSLGKDTNIRKWGGKK